MATKKKVIKPKLPPFHNKKFVAIQGDYVIGSGASEQGPINAANKSFQEQRYYNRNKEVLIYQLVSVVRAKPVPIEIESVAVCQPCSEAEGE